VSCDEPFLVVTDARRREVYWAEYRSPGSVEARLHARLAATPAVARPAEVVTECRVAAGHGAGLYAETLGVSTIDPEYPSPRGIALAAAPEVLTGAEPAPVTPVYLRQPHATEPGPRKRVSA